MILDQLLSETKLKIVEKNMPLTIKGLYADNVIWINKEINSQVEKACVLAEELGHHHTSSGDITDQKKTLNRKQELIARQWAHNKLIPLERIIEAYAAGVKGRYDIAEFLGVTEEFLQEAVKRYYDKYGCYKTVGKYTIFFDPLGVMESFK